MDKAITTAIFIVISMIMAIMLFNVAYPAIIQGGEAISSMAFNVSDRMGYQISVIHASSERSNTGWWNDANGNGTFEVTGWAKNIGDSRIIAIDRIDVFFGPEGNFTRIPSQTEANGNLPYWTPTLNNDTEWDPTATLQIAIHFQAPLDAGRYYMKVALPNGISSEYFLGI